MKNEEETLLTLFIEVCVVSCEFNTCRTHAYAYALTTFDVKINLKGVFIMSEMKVVVMSKEGDYISTYSGISRISPSYNGDKIFLTKELTQEEMTLYERDPNEDEDYITCTVENAKQVQLIITMM